MNQLFKSLTASALAFAATTALASPAYLVTHNKTNVESNAYVAGKASPHPTAPKSDGKVSWYVVRMACFGHTDKNICKAVIKMATDTPNPVDIGEVSLNVETGEISPTSLSRNGYTITVNGPGEATLTKN
ncbi:hypothetical protein [Legionella jamestowniensis]|uniref:Uncharacterized protein n=1 Tax=Legionella jamestowniensis TaxID=455 RepID=A0A0W0UWC4_9GAMM|nr:hypothetical protein [Legionella jamestowniensis]KTD12186.1 hypothetical protein Ljam_0402 [Legionella jamestowniensis]OCH98658.1 hypothetical protein A8135_11285 [Legionella jamestowniensis]SFL75728.1 hypothetical protein SAMN02746073_1720 [Legionella jamestowniensis DSM 19215]